MRAGQGKGLIVYQKPATNVLVRASTASKISTFACLVHAATTRVSSATTARRWAAAWLPPGIGGKWHAILGEELDVILSSRSVPLAIAWRITAPKLTALWGYKDGLVEIVLSGFELCGFHADAPDSWRKAPGAQTRGMGSSPFYGITIS